MIIFMICFIDNSFHRGGVSAKARVRWQLYIKYILANRLHKTVIRAVTEMTHKAPTNLNIISET